MNCDTCSGNTRNQMDMHRHRNTMNDRYTHGQMMPRVSRDCDGCHREADVLRGIPLAMAYVPWQQFECTYEPAQALRAGTIFPELDKPFYGKRGMR